MDSPTPAQAAPITPAPAAAPTGADTATPQSPDLGKMSLAEMDTLFLTGTVELPAAGAEGVVQEAPAPAAKVEPEPGVTPAVVEPEPVVVEPVVEVVETRSAEQIQVDQAAAVEAVVAAGGDEAAQQAAAEAAAQPVAAVEPVVESVTTDEDPPERFRVKDPFARAALAIYKAAEAAGTPITLAEAESRARGPKVEPVAPAPVVIQSVKIAEKVTALEAEVVALETQISDGSDEVLPTRELAKLQNQHARKAAELAATQVQLETARQTEKQAIQAQSDAARDISIAESQTDWPDAANGDSVLGKAIAAEITALENENHPDHSILWADSAPYVIASRVAKRLGIPPAAKKAATPPAKPIVAPPRKTVAPVSAAKTAVPATPQPAEDAKATIDRALKGDASVEEMDVMQGARGGLSALLAGAAR